MQETRKIAITASMENVSLTLATLKMDPVNPEKNATIDGTNRKRKEAPPNTETTRLPAEAVEACAVKVCIFILMKIPNSQQNSKKRVHNFENIEISFVGSLLVWTFYST